MLDTPVSFELPAIVVTASRAPQVQAESPAATTVVDGARIERLGDPLVASLLRLVPSAAVATSGPAGSQTQVRIRGAEANHTLLFIDGINANDPAAGNQPRFELLNADLVSRIEVVRGPQSALWGSEAIGGVVAVKGVSADALSSDVWAMVEGGSFDFRRASASAAFGSNNAGIALGASWQSAGGIDSFDGTGDRDGYRNASVRLRARARPTSAIEVGLAGFAISASNEFDGYDPATFVRADTLDSTRNRLAAGRAWGTWGDDRTPWTATLSASLLGSSNRNLLDGDPVNRTRADRRTIAGQIERRFATGTVEHRLILAGEAEREKFHARDAIYSGASDQDRSRRHESLTAEWRTNLTNRISGGVAVRHDRFNRFRDSTSVRAGALVTAGRGIGLAVNYGEGIAQPTFFDLYGFFPGSFVGNPGLLPESSRGIEASARIERATWDGSLTFHHQRLRDEIIDVFDSSTFRSTTANADGKSRRQGAELSVGWRPNAALRLTAVYAYLEADERQGPMTASAREGRRPRHSGTIGLDGASGRVSYGTSFSYTGSRRDIDFDRFPALPVRLASYWLASGRVAVSIGDRFQMFARVTNAFDTSYQDAVGYRTEGRSVHGGIRLAAGR